jgi:hypothetical protein
MRRYNFSAAVPASAGTTHNAHEPPYRNKLNGRGILWRLCGFGFG